MGEVRLLLEVPELRDEHIDADGLLGVRGGRSSRQGRADPQRWVEVLPSMREVRDRGTNLDRVLMTAGSANTLSNPAFRARTDGLS